MLEENKDLIIKNFLILMKDCNVDVLKQLLVDKGIFSQSEIIQIFSSNDARHNKRIFFFNIQKKEQNAFNVLVESLKKTNQHNIVKLLVPEAKGCKTFSLPPESNADDDYLNENIPLHVSSDTTSLTVKVVRANEFLDTEAHNKKIEFYSSRSKKRGKVLIINNFDYADKKEHPYRNGAQVDNANLQELFNQMGGWEINLINNATVEQMVHRLILFTQDKENKQYDICFVIIMGHGEEQSNRTIIFGIDGKFISSEDVQKHFTNEKCKSFRGKPKVFLFQVCRGSALDHTIRHTETDSALRSGPSSDYQKIDSHIRTKEDMLIGFATLHENEQIFYDQDMLSSDDSTEEESEDSSDEAEN
ncbi:caspase-2-like isoform X2 [Anoplophora glabripennis]|uniref:caspase-2-like isoform X2 n=1 Tax=Anoplophora glabripennis TaxID=217634 RepID=UPI000873A43D|nr:caspase-2-like isoform X2 [Anoplophora glabripennis]